MTSVFIQQLMFYIYMTCTRASLATEPLFLMVCVTERSTVAGLVTLAVPEEWSNSLIER